MTQICHCCNQVVPETELEKSLAATKAATAKTRITEAQTAWEAFDKKHPVRGFWKRNDGLRLALLILTMAIIVGGIMAWMINHDPMAIHFLLFMFVCVVACVVLIYFMYDLPNKRSFKQRMAAQNAFILRHSKDAAILGFAMYRE